jgi:hypothetical protein
MYFVGVDRVRRSICNWRLVTRLYLRFWISLI